MFVKFLIESNDSCRDQLRQVMQRKGIRVRHAGDAHEIAGVDADAGSVLVLIDARSDAAKAPALVRAIRKICPHAGIIMMLDPAAGTQGRLSGYEAGADCCLAGPVGADELAAVAKALARRLPEDCGPRGPNGAKKRRGNLPEDLPKRLRQIARLLMGTDLIVKEIADELGVHVGTARKHVERLYRRLDVRSRAELTARYNSDHLPARTRKYALLPHLRKKNHD